jgi:polysaccharide biosynthesis protein PslL
VTVIAATHQKPVFARNVVLDIAKGLGIIAVVLGHSPVFALGEWGDLKRIIFSFHVPLFFFLAGVFVRESQGVEAFARSKADSLLKPYFAILAGLGAAKFVVSAMSGGAEFPAGKYFTGMLYGTGASIALPPMWFLPHLFVALILTLAAAKCFKSSALGWLVAALSLAMGVFWLREGLAPNSGLPWSIDLLPVTFAFAMAGYLCRQSVKCLKFDPFRFTLSAVAFASLHYGFDEAMDLNMRVYGVFPVATAEAVLGIYLCLSLSSALIRFARPAAALAYVGTGTLFVLMFHSLIEYKVFPMLMGWTGSASISAVAGVIAGVLIPLFLFEAVRRNRWLSMLLLPANVSRAQKPTPEPATPVP